MSGADQRSLHRYTHACAFDPGQSTGAVLADWLVIDLGRHPTSWADVVWTSATILEDKLAGWLQERGTRFVRECSFRGEPLTVLIERPPQRAREPGGAARIIQEWLRDVRCHTEVIWASPGEWKPWVKANPLRLTAGSQHEKDAANLLRWWLETRSKS